MDLYTKIKSIENIQEAYLEVVQKFENINRTHRYYGIDGRNLSSYDFDSLDLVKKIQSELIDNTPVFPALEKHIPKKNKQGTRPVYIHTLKERVKSQAVYRVVEPFLNDFFSDYLFSYRTTHLHYSALKTIRRYYLRSYHKENEYILIGDISSYSDIINPQILKQKIRETGLPEKVCSLLDTYVDMEFFDTSGNKKKSEEGIITGLPITVLFNNLYLDSFDKRFGNQVKLYRRVGDDFVACGSLDKLTHIQKDMRKSLQKVAIQESHQKIHIQKISEGFGFLGYYFNKGTISILPKSIKNMQIFFRKKLKYYPHLSPSQKKQKLYDLLYKGGESFHFYFLQIVRQYNYINDHQQILWLSDYFFKRLVIYFFGSYSKKYHKETVEITSDLDIPSLSQYYFSFQKGDRKYFHIDPSKKYYEYFKRTN